MRVIIKLFGGLKSKRAFPQNEEGDLILEFTEPIAVGEIIETLDLNKKPFIVILNGLNLVDFSIKVKEGDEISLFPPIAGGQC